MAINLARLEQAADRFENYAEKMQHVDSEAARAERGRVAQRHREQFLPAAEKFQQLRSVVAAARAAVVVTVAPPEAGPVVVTVGGVIPEIIQRDNDLRPVRYLQIALMAARSVGRVRVVDATGDDEGDGTGFLVAPGLLLTNWHVLKTRELAEGCSVIFDDEDGLDGDPKETKAYRFLPQRLYVSDEVLDYAIVEVSPRTNSGTPLSQFGYLRLFEQTGKLDPTQRQAANIVQHPSGGPKKIAVRDNYFAQVMPDSVDPAKEVSSLFYGTDTLKGSSGAPVCSDQWYVVALHRGGVPATVEVNGTEYDRVLDRYYTGRAAEDAWRAAAIQNYQPPHAEVDLKPHLTSELYYYAQPVDPWRSEPESTATFVPQVKSVDISATFARKLKAAQALKTVNHAMAMRLKEQLAASKRSLPLLSTVDDKSVERLVEENIRGLARVSAQGTNYPMAEQFRYAGVEFRIPSKYLKEE